MLNDFSLLKLNRGIWVALLEQEKILEAISYYEGYRDNIIYAAKNKSIKSEAQKELQKSEIIFITKLQTIAKKYYQEKDYSNALICYTTVFKYQPINIESTNDYIECLKQNGQHDLVIEIGNFLKTLDTSNFEINKIIAESYKSEGDYKKAVEYLEKYIKTKGENSCSAYELNYLGCYYDILYSNNPEPEYAKESIRLFKKAHEFDPREKCYLKNLTIIAIKSNDKETAKAAWEELIKFKGLTNYDKFDYACFCLKMKNFEGWRKYFKHRFVLEVNPTQFPKLSKPEWDGKKDLSESTLLVRFEQGFGDTILTWGYIPRLKKIAKKVKVVVQNELYELLKDNEYSVEVIADRDFDEKKIKYDYYLPSMTIAIALKLDETNISVGESYINIDPKHRDEYKKQYFKSPKMKIGISISGSKAGNLTRDIPIEELAKLDKLKDVEFYILNKNIPDEDLKIFKKNKVVNIAKEFKNFKDTAAAMKNLDLVITSDNCIMNLAGALGLKTYAIFNWSYEYRWFDLTKENTIWLTSVKPFVNDKMNNWEYSVENILKEIKR